MCGTVCISEKGWWCLYSMTIFRPGSVLVGSVEAISTCPILLLIIGQQYVWYGMPRVVGDV